MNQSGPLLACTTPCEDGKKGSTSPLNPSGLIRGSSGQMQPSRHGLASKTGPLCEEN